MTRLLAPEPAQRVGKDRAAVFSTVPAVAEDELMIVAGELQRRGHFLVRERPVAVQIIEIIRAILQEDAERLRLLLRFANEPRVHVAAADIGEAPDEADHL